MKVKVFRIDTIEEFAKSHSNGKKHFDRFLKSLEYADWEVPTDMLNSYRGNLLGGGSSRVVYDIGGNGQNAFRIICHYRFGNKIRLYVNCIGTHEEYNRLTKEDKLIISKY
jgi:mRNA-degrading endonuclease HigB of HigAB toxin-antitoxin module